jgi:MFS family permease
MYDTVITTLMAHDGENSALMSYMYAMFGLGATISPLIIGTLVDHDIHWKRYYYVPLGLCVLLSIAGLYVFAGCKPAASS